MAKSILCSNDNECILCGKTTGLHTHHAINGNPGRRNSEKYGLKVRLCVKHHELIHKDQNLDLWLKRYAEEKFISKYGFKKWMEVFHKNYL